jgi:hypothetical protein
MTPRNELVYREFKTNKTSILIPLVLIVAHYSSGSDSREGTDEISDFTKT